MLGVTHYTELLTQGMRIWEILKLFLYKTICGVRTIHLEMERAGQQVLFDHADLCRRLVSIWGWGRSFITFQFSAPVLKWPLAGASFTEMDTHVLGIGLETSN